MIFVIKTCAMWRSYHFWVWGHSTTTYVDKKGGRGCQQKVHTFPPRKVSLGVQCPRGQKFEKKGIEESWQMTMKSFITVHKR